MTDTRSAQISRRGFLKASSAAVAAGLAPRRLRAQNSPAPPSEKIRLGFIGIAGRGNALFGDFTKFDDVQVSAVCDVSADHLNAAVERTGGKAKAYKDFRKLLEDSSVDAVVVATPPHWHPLISILACEAGKDVYCEKPMSLRADEATAMVKAANDNKRVTQLGTQIHAGENYRRVVEIVRSGALGKIVSVRTMVTLNEFPGNLGNSPDSDPPAGLDWDMWLGPLQKRPYNKALFESGGHRYFRQTVGSWMNELGPHIMDLAFWAMGAGIPSSAAASGGRFALQDISDIPDTLDVVYEYPDYSMTFTHTATNGYNFGFGEEPNRGRRLAVFFHGTNGTLAAGYGDYRVYQEGGKEEFQAPAPSIPPSPGHQREFLDAIKTRVQPPCHFGYHHPLAVAIAMGHAALFTGEKVSWDAGRSRVAGSRRVMEEAVSRYRSPWKLP